MLEKFRWHFIHGADAKHRVPLRPAAPDDIPMNNKSNAGAQLKWQK
jgi:hypothetical protein